MKKLNFSLIKAPYHTLEFNSSQSFSKIGTIISPDISMIESKYKILITCILIYLYKYQICLFLTITFIELGNSVLPIFNFSHFSIFFELLEKKMSNSKIINI